MSSRWLRLLLVAGTVEAVFALVLRLDEVHRLVRGERSLAGLIAIAGLFWLVVLLMAMVGVAATMRSARSRLATSESAVTGMASASRDWVWEADTELRLTYCSTRVAEQLGYAPEDLIGVAMPTLMPPDCEAEARRLLAESIATGTGWQDVELTWRHADGSLVTLQGSAEPIFEADGRLIGFRGVRRLVTPAMTVERAILAARARIQATLDAGEIDVALQPIVDIATGQLRGAEALARFRDGRGPDVWFGEARDAGRGLALDLATFNAALATIPQLPETAYLSVNATPELISDPGWQASLLHGHHPLDRLVVEITEHVEIDRYDDLTAALLPLRERGLRLAIDDTGAGYASFSHVLQLRPDIIKIDRSLVGHLADDPARRALVTALVLLALELGAALTAEGVETARELDTLATLGVDNAQGYYLARPTTDTAKWRRWATKTWVTSTPARPRRARTAAV